MVLVRVLEGESWELWLGGMMMLIYNKRKNNTGMRLGERGWGKGDVV